MKHVKILSAIGLLAIGSAANAAVTSTWTVTNDYDFRGITQTGDKPALQASLDLATDSGWYAGTWGSNVDFVAFDGSAIKNELDLYTGFTGTAGGFTYDAGLIYYTYDESQAAFPELYVSGTVGPFKGKIWYSNEFGGTGPDGDSGSESAFYVEGNLTLPLGGPFSLLAHAGYSFGDYWDKLGEAVGDPGEDGKYIDYSIGVGGTFGKFSTTMKYVGTKSDLDETADGEPAGLGFDKDRRLVFSVATTFPWE